MSIILTIMDGFGLRDKSSGNAIRQATTPNLNKIFYEYSTSKLEASGEAVGLPAGQMGNSEVGHLNIGSGRVIYQPLEEINRSIKIGEFYNNEEFISVMEHVKKNNSKLHLFGLLSDGGIHSTIEHFFALIKMARDNNVDNVYVHAFLDGRDTKPDTAAKYLDMLSDKLGEYKLADISGRYYSMDRERMWDLTKKYYDLLVYGNAVKIDDYNKYLQESYNNKVFDEFIEPAIIDGNGKLEENDGLIFVNFRPDRATQTFTAITNPDFNEFETVKFNNIKLVTMMEVEDSIISVPAFKKKEVKNSLGVYVAESGFNVLRIAEASKYPHVTYFFDGGLEMDIKNTDKIIIPRKDVRTYDLAPAMSAKEITDKVIEVIDKYDLVILNYANCDMVGHTGNMEAAISAVEAVDNEIGRLYEMCQEKGNTMVIIADHGNADIMVDDDGNVCTTHTTSLVPFVITDHKYITHDGKLADVAPTILKMMNLSIPSEMDGNVIID